MMIIVAVHDMAVESYVSPMFVLSAAAAVRSFADEVNRPESQIAAHPEDYSLWQLGELDAVTGTVVPCTPRRLVAAIYMRR